MLTFFNRNNYPDMITSSAITKLNQLSQEDDLQPVQRNFNNRIPFVLTYHPLNNTIKKVIYNNFHLLHNDDTCKDIFQLPPLMAFR